MEMEKEKKKKKTNNPNNPCTKIQHPPVFHGAGEKKRKKGRQKPGDKFFLLDPTDTVLPIERAFVIINSGRGAYFTMKGGCRGARQPSTCGPEIGPANSMRPTSPSALTRSSPLR